MAKQNKDEAVKWYAQNRGLYKKLSQKIHNIILELLEESNITIHGISNRAKEVDSFKNKIEDVKYTDPLNQVTDFSGTRVIAYVEDDLKPICDIIKSAFEIDEVNSGDKSTDLGTDKVGYKSIHFIAKLKQDRLKLPEYKKYKDLKFEIQVRTILQYAWAEIEHDRNYKFKGVLPPEIKRRFKVLAGTLELVDSEFNKLSIEIDNISQNVTIADKDNDLNSIPINSTTIKQFLINRFDDLLEKGLLEPTLYKDEVILNELNDFGIMTLGDLNKIIPEDFKRKYAYSLDKSSPLSFAGVLRDIMMAKDYKKYFKNVWQNAWIDIDSQTFKFLETFGIDPNELVNDYGLIIGK